MGSIDISPTTPNPISRDNGDDLKPLGSSLYWEEVGINRYERRIDDLEKFYMLMESLGEGFPGQNWMINAGIKFVTDRPRATLIADVKRVWVALRHQHPVLSSVIEGDRFVYRAVDQAEMKAVADQRSGSVLAEFW